MAFFEIGKKGEELVSSSGIFQGNHEKYTRHFLKKYINFLHLTAYQSRDISEVGSLSYMLILMLTS